LISAAPFRDRVVHHALCNLIEPVIEKSFIYDSYANRAGKGTHKAMHRAQQFARRFKYVLTCDVRQFFPSIDHEILLFVIARGLLRAGERRTRNDRLSLIEKILQSGVGVLREEFFRRRSFFRQPPARPADWESHQPVLGKLLSQSPRSFCKTQTSMQGLREICG
jgi:hypothetical protein